MRWFLCQGEATRKEPSSPVFLPGCTTPPGQAQEPPRTRAHARAAPICAQVGSLKLVAYHASCLPRRLINCFAARTTSGALEDHQQRFQSLASDVSLEVYTQVTPRMLQKAADLIDQNGVPEAPPENKKSAKE